MICKLLPVLALTSCVAIPTSHPTTLVHLDIDGSPRVLPGGPSIYIDDVYRGNPVGDSFHIRLPVGEHDARLMGGSELVWEGVIHVERSSATQVIEIRYEQPVAVRT